MTRTKGPWAATYQPLKHQYVVTSQDDVIIAVVPVVTGTERDKEDARLIAAAPDLLDALVLLVGDDETEESAVMPDSEKRNMARAAIAKATGKKS
jgi:hypothetical protein